MRPTILATTRTRMTPSNGWSEMHCVRRKRGIGTVWTDHGLNGRLIDCSISAKRLYDYDFRRRQEQACSV